MMKLKGLLMIPAAILFPIFGIIGGLYSLRYLFTKGFFKDLDDKLFRTALVFDQGANVWLKEVLNDHCIVEEGHKYGHQDNTISEITGLNERDNYLTKFGWGFTKFLSVFLGDNHAIKSIGT